MCRRHFSTFRVHVWVWELRKDGVPVCSVLAPYGWHAQNAVIQAFGKYPEGMELEATKLYKSMEMKGQVYE